LRTARVSAHPCDASEEAPVPDQRGHPDRGDDPGRDDPGRDDPGAHDDPRSPDGHRRPGAVVAALAGLLSAAVAIGAAELITGLLGITSVVIAIGEGVIQLAPPALTDFAIETLGGLNRSALITGTVVVLALLSLGIGLLARRSFVAGALAIVAVGAVGILASLSYAADPFPASLGPGLAAMVAGVAALWVALTAAAGRPSSGGGSAAAEDGGRREFVLAAAGLSIVAAAGVAGGRWLQERMSAAQERMQLTLPAPDASAEPLPDGVDFDLDGLSSFVTPNETFYRVDTAVQVPRVRADEWTLRIHGMVDRELELDWASLLDRELVQIDTTLMCVSNPVGGDLVGNARWLGVRLDDLLGEAGVQDGATQLVPRSVDGYAGGFPVADALDGRNAILAIAMNDEPLPPEHGYPVRLVVPGLYGYVSAVKWLAELELTTFEAFDHYWFRRGWAQQAPIKVQSRIDRPAAASEVAAGGYVVAGVAWAQTRGIERVEVQIDDGEWQETELAAVPSDNTWRQWRYSWQAEPGDHRIRVRATDADGTTQDEERVDPIPDGAEGWHTVQVTVTG
jgi:sulfite oxidase